MVRLLCLTIGGNIYLSPWRIFISNILGYRIFLTWSEKRRTLWIAKKENLSVLSNFQLWICLHTSFTATIGEHFGYLRKKTLQFWAITNYEYVCILHTQRSPSFVAKAKSQPQNEFEWEYELTRLFKHLTLPLTKLKWCWFICIKKIISNTSDGSNNLPFDLINLQSQ